MNVVGLLPAGGMATRLSGLPKFLLPCPDGYLLKRHIDKMREAGAQKVWIAASKATAPFVKPYAENATAKTYETGTMPGDLLAIRDFCSDDTVLFGLPDTYWTYSETYPKLLHRIQEFGADVAVGLWRIRNDQRGKLGQVDTYGDRCTRIVDKAPDCLLPWVWGAIAWQPVFWDFIKPDMSHMGMALQAAIDGGLKVWPVMIEGDYFDCGSWEEYALMCAQTSGVLAYGR